MRKKLISIVLVVTLLLSLCATASARGVLASKFINNVVLSVEAQGGSEMKLYAFVTATDTMSRVGVSEVVIEEATSQNGPWREYEVWSCSGSDYYANNSIKFDGMFSFSGTPGRYYRAHVTSYAMQVGEGSDSVFGTTPVRKCV